MYSAAELFACSPQTCDIPRFYATSWAMFAMLVSRHLDGMNAYLASLSLGVPDKEAWHSAFPQLSDLGELDRELRNWLALGTVPTLRLQIPKLAPMEIGVRAMSDADVLGVRGLARLVFGHDKANASADANAAIQLEPTHLVANLVAGAISWPIPKERGRAIAQAHPTDWRAWVFTNVKRECEIVATDPNAATPDACRKRPSPSSPPGS